MEIDHSDEALSSAIKQFLSRYGIILLILFLTLCGSIEGYQYWKAQQASKRQQASVLFNQMLQAMDAHNSITQARLRHQLKAQHAKAGFSTLTSLMEAKQAVDLGHFDDAIAALQSILTQQKQGPLHDIASIRLARLYGARNQTDKALNILNTVKEPSFALWANFFKSQIYLKKGEPAKAIDLIKRLKSDPNVKESPLFPLVLAEYASFNPLSQIKKQQSLRKKS
jgi:predicted negative regulator of RcsB-dependent stress response